MLAWKAAGFRVVDHLVFTKPYASKSAFVGYQHESAYVLAKGRPPLPLSGSVRQQLFPGYCFALDDRSEKKRALSMHAAARREAS